MFSLMDVLTRPFRSASSPHVRRGQETPLADNMKSSRTNKQLPDAVDGTAPPRRLHLAQLLREAHTEQKRNTRALEESYHALRKSTRLLEQRWERYCNELERELNASNWRGAPPAPVDSYEGRRSMPDLDKDAANSLEDNAAVRPVDSPKRTRKRDLPQVHKFPEVSSTGEFDWHNTTGKPTGSPTGRSRSNAIQHLESQRPPACSSSLPKAEEPPTVMHALPLRPTESRPSHKVRLPLGFPGSNTTQLPTSKTPAWPASLPTREQLVALSEQSRHRLLPAKPPAINIIPSTPPQSPQSTMTLQELPPPVRITDFNSHIHQSTESYSHYRPQQASMNGKVNFSLPHAQTKATKKEKATLAHETSTHQS